MKTPTKELKTCLKQIWLVDQTEKRKKKIKLSEYLRNYILNRLGVRATQKYRLYPCVSRPQLFCFG